MTNYIPVDKLKAEIDRQEIGCNTDGKHTAEYNTCRKILNIIDSLQEEQPETIDGVVHCALNAHWLVVNQKKLSARLKQFPEGTEVEILINARKEK